MLSVSAKKSGGKRKSERPAAVLADEAGLVLPRPFRRVARFVIALCAGKVAVPDHLGKLSFLAYCVAVGGYGIVQGGHWPVVEQAMTSTAGFAIEDVKLSGNVHTSEIDVLQSLGLDGTTSLVAINADEARRRVSELPWIQSVEVRKIYPRTIEVNVKEREAYGIWQHGSELSLIEKNGSVIAPLRDNKFASLPLFVGRDAEVAAQDVDADFDGWPEIKARIKAYVRVASRRWDVHLDNGVVVKLPEEDVGAALARLARMEGEEKLLERDILAVDLRLPDRMAVQLTPEADQRRQAAVAARTKAVKQAEQRI
ncbi:cell division protein FtsQ/DivIB [Rhizobium paknamense]|uniref:Cell division protein FtsQ n=1 Tax=Rhizobium paknamense TaxID=1206817 RepID=A0ABU0I985_9HYPH|nr:cell division protein FtsQ/DivIB [Rhizobium paknamense]MDQ0454799.1 cell division protein FtsQ [Rhizobium paknamense]